MSLWIGFAIALVIFIVCAGYVALGAFDPEGRGSPRDGAAMGVAVLSALIAAGFVGALLHRHFA